jgi:hypothetical protein
MKSFDLHEINRYLICICVYDNKKTKNKKQISIQFYLQKQEVRQLFTQQLYYQVKDSSANLNFFHICNLRLKRDKTAAYSKANFAADANQERKLLRFGSVFPIHVVMFQFRELIL